jgi:hypothetical protein
MPCKEKERLMASYGLTTARFAEIVVWRPHSRLRG